MPACIGMTYGAGGQTLVLRRIHASVGAAVLSSPVGPLKTDFSEYWKTPPLNRRLMNKIRGCPRWRGSSRTAPIQKPDLLEEAERWSSRLKESARHATIPGFDPAVSDALSQGFSWFNRLGLFFNSDRRLRPCIRSPYGGGSGGTRTRTAVKPLDFKSNVSTCSTTLPPVSPYTTDRMQQARQSVFLRRGAVAVGRRSAHRGIGPCGPRHPRSGPMPGTSAAPLEGTRAGRRVGPGHPPTAPGPAAQTSPMSASAKTKVPGMAHSPAAGR